MSSLIPPRPELAGVPQVPHGGFDGAVGATEILDFSANVNPFGPPPRVAAVLRDVPLARHPDPRAMPLRRLLASQIGCDPDEVLVGNGSVDLIYQLAVAYLRPGDRVLIAGPTFGEYAAAAAVMGADVHTITAAAENGFAPDRAALQAAVRELQPRLLFLCNPNNPTGAYLDQAAVANLLAGCPQTLLVLDEAYAGFVAAPWPATALLPAGNLLVLRSLTKDYALTGLRLGYAVGTAATIRALATVQPPWSVNAFAQAAGLAALNDPAYVRDTLAQLAAAKEDLVAALVAAGFRPLPSPVNYFVLPVRSAPVATRLLYERGLRVRDCSSFGLPEYVRIATQRPAANQRLAAALTDLKEELCPPVS